MKFYIFALVLFFCGVCCGSNLVLETIRTSDEIYLRGGSARYDFSDKTWVGVLEQELEFRRELEPGTSGVHKFEVGREVILSEQGVLGLALSHVWLEGPVDNRQTVMGKLSYQKVLNKFDFLVSLEKQSLAETLKSTASQGVLLNEFRKTIVFNYHWNPIWKSSVQGFHTHLNDENKGYLYDVSTHYGLSPSWPWIWVGYGVHGLSYDQTAVGYWSPDRFFNHGPRFDSSFPLYGKFSGIFALNLNYFKENNLSGEGYLMAAGLQWGQFDGNHVRLVYNKIRSSQNQSAWIYEGLQLTCNVISF